jgi:hypothetical protein
VPSDIWTNYTPGGSLEEVEYAPEHLKVMRHWFEEHNEVVCIQGDPMRDWTNLKVLKQRSAVGCPDQGVENLHNQEKEHVREGIPLAKPAGVTNPLARHPIEHNFGACTG